MKAREKAATARIAALKGDVSAVFWYSSAKLNADPYLAGQGGVPAYLMSELGIQNVVDSNEEWPTAGWETVAKANPTLIVAGDMTRRRFEGDDIAVKRGFLAKDPVASVMDAVRQGRIVEMKVQFMDPTVRTVRGFEVLADALERVRPRPTGASDGLVLMERLLPGLSEARHRGTLQRQNDVRIAGSPVRFSSRAFR